MVHASHGWKVLKMLFMLLTFLITLRFDTLREHLKDERKSSYDFMLSKENHIIFKCINKDAWVYTLFTRWHIIFEDST